MTDLLFDQPWWLPTSIIIVGIALFISGNRRQLTRLRNAGAIIVLIAVAFSLISFFVETDKEKCVRQTHELVDSVVSADWKKAESLMDPKVTLGLVSVTVYTDRAALIKGAQDGCTTYGLKACHVMSIKATQTQSLITVNMNVVTEQDSTMGRPLPSNWEIEYERTESGWQIDRLTCFSIDDLNLDEMNRQFPR
jgi:hypothetical protein